MIKRFASNPEYIKAVQWTVDNIKEIERFIGVSCETIDKTICINNGTEVEWVSKNVVRCVNPLPSIKEEGKIEYIECYPNDWIVFDEKRNFYFVMYNEELISSYHEY